jgi:D-alanyl-D-alanine carboxypeptidase
LAILAENPKNYCIFNNLGVDFSESFSIFMFKSFNRPLEEKAMKNYNFSYILFFILFFLNFFLKPSFSYAEEEQGVENINALSGVVLDAKTGMVLYAKNPHVKIPPASTVKLLTAMVVLDHLPLHKKVKISKNAEETPSVAPFLRDGEVYTVEELLNLMLIKSSNQAAVALAEAVSGTEENFSVLMNAKAKALGLQNSKFQTASGLPASDQYSTAYDLALLLYEALKYPKISEIIQTPVKIITNEQGRTIIVKNTNHLLFEDGYKEAVIGGKTGYTKLSKHCLVNVAKIKDRLVITSILGAPNRESLWQDTKRMLKIAELVLENKINPVYVNTVVNLSQPVNHVYTVKNKIKSTKHEKKVNKKLLAKAKGKGNKTLIAKTSDKNVKKLNTKIAKNKVTSTQNIASRKKSKGIKTAQTEARRNG